MMRSRSIRIRTLMAALTTLSLSACISVQPPGDAVPTSLEAARTLAADSTVTTPVPTVRWGGSIVAIANTDQGSTLEVVARPLDRAGRPIHNDRSEGRFQADYAGFLDPEIYTSGRDVTILGPLSGTRQGLIGETRYTFPVVSVEALRYWQPRLPPGHMAYPPGLHGLHHSGWHLFHPDWPHAYHPSPPRRRIVGGEVAL